MISMVSLDSGRLLLREFNEEDFDSVHLYAVDPEVVRYMPWGPNSESDTRNFINTAISYQREQPRTKYELAVVLKEEGILIGGCGIRISNPELKEADFGYCLNRNYWRRGCATEIARTLLEFGFCKLNLHRIYATCDPENIASKRVLEKMGMSLEGHFRESIQIRGEWRDLLLYAILDNEWIK
jgi:RimJ/RimL family protein N-acetyltransferase